VYWPVISSARDERPEESPASREHAFAEYFLRFQRHEMPWLAFNHEMCANRAGDSAQADSADIARGKWVARVDGAPVIAAAEEADGRLSRDSARAK